MGINKNCCSDQVAPKSVEYETVQLEKTAKVCSVCEAYAEKQKEKPVAIMSCDGACLRGEVSRQAANMICHSIAPEQTVRICLGGAFTKDTGQRNLVRNAERVVALEGCLIRCASRMMNGVVEGLEPEVILTDGLFEFDKNLFGVNEMPEREIRQHAKTVAEKVVQRLNLATSR